VTYPANDDEYEDKIIAAVEVGKDGIVDSFTTDDGWTLGWRADAPLVPRPGDWVREYGRGIGSPVRGLFVNGVEIWYQTDADYLAEFERQRTARDAKMREGAEAAKPETDARLAALPLVFQKRIARFMANNADFWWRHLPYELFCCEQAVMIANALETPEAVAAFHDDRDYERQHTTLPRLAWDQHSGNTFDCACSLSYWYLREPEAVIVAPGALSVIVGAKAYGETAL
jgi:hypothetical protein